jgi:hypothetical protein
MEPHDPNASWELVLVPVADPLTRYGHAERPVAMRIKAALKALLRQHGLRCDSFRPVATSSPEAGPIDAPPPETAPRAPKPRRPRPPRGRLF